MFKYILKRILIFIPTLLIISLITFIISTNAPGDPVEQMLNLGAGGEGQLSNVLSTEKSYMELREKLGLDLPVFYFSFGSLATPDTLYRLPKREHKKNLSRLVDLWGNWPYIEKYYHSLRELELASYTVKQDSLNAPALIRIKESVNELYLSYRDKKIEKEIAGLQKTIAGAEVTPLQPLADKLHDRYEAVKKNSEKWKNYVPALNLYGVDNQYHQWITNFLVGDFGISYQDKRPVSSVLWDAIRWTLLISLLSMALTYIISIPIGVLSAVKKGSVTDSITTTFLFILYSLPNFWIATLLIMFFGGGDYLDWFPSYGVGALSEDDPFIERFFDTGWHLLLPLFCWTYPSLAFLSRQMRGGMLAVLGQDYIRTARAKGLPEKQVVWKHAFRNSLLPIITLFANVFPLAIGGSIVLEYIFSIPGMGKLGYDAVVARNYPIVFTVMMFSAVLTLIGYLVADILYAVVDPRISFSDKKE